MEPSTNRRYVCFMAPRLARKTLEVGSTCAGTSGWIERLRTAIKRRSWHKKLDQAHKMESLGTTRAMWVECGLFDTGARPDKNFHSAQFEQLSESYEIS